MVSSPFPWPWRPYWGRFGTTLIVQLLTFDISAIIPILILVGVIMFRRAGRTKLRDFGRVFIGLGLILLALRLMTDSLSSVEHSDALREVLSLLTRDPVFDLAAAALLTWAAHSSVATVLLVMSLTPGVISLNAALALVLGANLGNTFPQLVAARADPGAKQLAIGNLAVRAIGCIVALPFLPNIAAWLSTAIPNGAAAVAAFHTLFNLGLALAILPLLDPLARLSAKLAPALPSRSDAEDYDSGHRLLARLGLCLSASADAGLFLDLRQIYPRAVQLLFRRLQFVSAALYSLGHGGNDAQKTMGIIAVLLYSQGALGSSFYIPTWVIIACNAAMAAGTLAGGWRIVKTMGDRITNLNPMQGSCAETGGAITLFLATFLGIPVSTTHTIAGAIAGVGAARRVSAVRWNIAGSIVIAWIFTLPASALIAAIAYYIAPLA